MQFIYKKLCAEENLSDEKVEKVIADYLYSERELFWDEVLDLIEGEKPIVTYSGAYPPSLE